MGNGLKLYLAGRMRGVQFYNFPAFDRARDELRALGYDPVSPADMDRETGFDGTLVSPADPCDKIPEGFDFDACVMRVTAAILKADGVCLIDLFWHESKGAAAELGIARWRGKRIFRLHHVPSSGHPYLIEDTGGR